MARPAQGQPVKLDRPPVHPGRGGEDERPAVTSGCHSSSIAAPGELAEVPCPGEFTPADGADVVVVFDDVALMALRAAAEDDRACEAAGVVQACPVESGQDSWPGGEVRAVPG